MRDFTTAALLEERQWRDGFVMELLPALRSLFAAFRKKAVLASRQKYFPGNYEPPVSLKEAACECERSPRAPLGIGEFRIYGFACAFFPFSPFLENAARCFAEVADAFVRGFGLYGTTPLRPYNCRKILKERYADFLAFAAGAMCGKKLLAEKSAQSGSFDAAILQILGACEIPGLEKRHVDIFLKGCDERGHIIQRDAFKRIHKEQLILQAAFNPASMKLESGFFIGLAKHLSLEMNAEDYIDGKAERELKKMTLHLEF